MDLTKFCDLRPKLYHLTASANLSSIMRDGRLTSAARLLGADASLTSKIRRPEHMVLTTDAGTVVLRDQQPLHSGNCLLSDGWRFEDLVFYLNSHVYFWPGDNSRPIRSGINHFLRYEAEDAVVLIVSTRDLLSTNFSPPLVTRVNSGAPRWSAGRPSPRGPETFVDISEFRGSPSNVVELVYAGGVTLPANVQVLTRAEWHRMIAS
jgi:hypothetical protein